MVKAQPSRPSCTHPGTTPKLFPLPPQHPLDEGAGGDDLVGVGGGVGEGVFDDDLADVSVAERLGHVGTGEIERPGARFRVKEGGFLTADGGEEPSAAGVVADVERHGVTFRRFSAGAPRPG